MKTKQATPPQSYVPGDTETLAPNSAGVLSFGVRTVYVSKPEGELQYLVFKPGFSAESDPACNHVLGSGFTFSRACESAARHLELLQRNPSDYWERLQGCTFQSMIEPGNVALQHLCVDHLGNELSRADTREEAARLALHRIVPSVADASYEEFAEIAAPIRLDLAGRGTHGAVFAEQRDVDAFNKLVRVMWRANPEVCRRASLRETDGRAALQCLGLAPDDTAREQAYTNFLSLMRREVLSAFAAMRSDAGIFRLGVEESGWAAILVLHSDRLSQREAMLGAYEEFMADQREVEAPALDRPIDRAMQA